MSILLVVVVERESCMVWLVRQLLGVRGRQAVCRAAVDLATEIDGTQGEGASAILWRQAVRTAGAAKASAVGAIRRADRRPVGDGRLCLLAGAGEPRLGAAVRRGVRLRARDQAQRILHPASLAVALADRRSRGAEAQRRRKNLAGEVFAVASARAKQHLQDAVADDPELRRLLDEVQSRSLDPLTAVREILEKVFHLNGDGTDAR